MSFLARYFSSLRRRPTSSSSPRRLWLSCLVTFRCSVRWLIRLVSSATWTSGEPVSPSLVAYSARISFLAAVSSGTFLLRIGANGFSGLIPLGRGSRMRVQHASPTRLVAGQRFTLPRTARRSYPPVSGASRRLLQRRGVLTAAASPALLDWANARPEHYAPPSAGPPPSGCAGAGTSSPGLVEGGRTARGARGAGDPASVRADLRGL